MTLDEVRKLHQRKHREASGCFLVEGEHLVLELQKAALREPRLRDSVLYVTRERESWSGPFARQVLSARQMAQISETRSPQGIVARVPMLPAAAPRRGERAICLCGIQDPGNLGTILRTLAWFGNLRCLLTPGSVDPYNAKAVRASLGALFHVPVEVDVPLEALPGRFGRIACLEMQGEGIEEPAFRGFDCYLFGNEARGLPREQVAALGAQPFSIRGAGAIESLNLAAAVNICVYELNRSR
jgi:TrmH family RNA methyltransferase